MTPPGSQSVYDEDFGIAGGAEETIVVGSATRINAQPLPAGRYFLYSTVDCWVKRGDGTQTIAQSASNASFLPALTLVPFQVTPGDAGVSGSPTTPARNIMMVRDANGTGIIRILPCSRTGSR